jgi:hypothetical protein
MPTAFAEFENDLGSVVDLDRFPIHLLADPRRAALVAETRAQIDILGCCRIPDFIRPEAVAEMHQEAVHLHDRTYWAELDHNPYVSPADEAFPEGHPRRFQQHRNSGFINSDELTQNSLLRRAYDSDVLLHFVWECLGVDRPIYRWADPVGRNPYGVMEPGHYFPWHFDGNEFTVSILVHRPEGGGVFEYVPDIRTPNDENYDRVQHVLEGGREGVHELDLMPGDLQLFKGRFSMHRVTRVEGGAARYVGLPTYVHDPYRMNRPHHSRTYYGRSTPMHEERAHLIVDGLQD